MMSTFRLHRWFPEYTIPLASCPRHLSNWLDKKKKKSSTTTITKTTTMITCAWKCASMRLHLSKVTSSNSWNIKNLMCIFCFSSQQRNEIHQSAIHQFYCRSLLLCHPKSPKGKLLVLCWKIVPRKNDSNRLNPLFSLSIKPATRPARDVWASWAPGRAAERISKAMFHGKQSVLYSHHATRMRI